MSKLLSSELTRMKKSKIFWLCLIAIFITSIWSMCMGADVAQSREVALEYYYFFLGPIMPLFFSVFISLFMGTEHSNHTIRNKMIIGYTRRQIYLSYCLTCLFGVEILVVIWFVGGLTGIPALGLWTFGVKELITLVIITMLYCAALTAILSYMSIMISSKSTSAVLQILLALALILIGSMLYNRLCEPAEVSEMILGVDGGIVAGDPKPNPMYIGGFARKICIMLVNILPTGQGILMLHRESAANIPIMPRVQMISSVVIFVGVIVIGMLSFSRKDLK